MTAQQYEALGQADFVAEYGLRMPVGFLENTTRHNVELDVMDETEAELLFCNPSHGRCPQAANEVVASDAALEDLGSQAEGGGPGDHPVHRPWADLHPGYGGLRLV